MASSWRRPDPCRSLELRNKVDGGGGHWVPTELKKVWLWSQLDPESDRRSPRFCCRGVCSGVGSRPGSKSPALTQPFGITKSVSPCERGRSVPLCRDTLITEPLLLCPIMHRSFSLFRWLLDEGVLLCKRWRCFWPMIQHTARPERAAPVENAETAATTSRFNVTRLSGSSIKLSCNRPARKRAKYVTIQKQQETWGQFY